MLQFIYSIIIFFKYQLLGGEQVPPDHPSRGPQGRLLQQVGRLWGRERRHQHQDHSLPLLRQQPDGASSNEKHHQSVKTIKSYSTLV